MHAPHQRQVPQFKTLIARPKRPKTFLTKTPAICAVESRDDCVELARRISLCARYAVMGKHCAAFSSFPICEMSQGDARPRVRRIVPLARERSHAVSYTHLTLPTILLV